MSRRLVIDLAATHAAWRIAARSVTAIQAALPGDWDVVDVRAPAVSAGDGGVGGPDAISAATGAEVYLGFGVPAGVVAAGRGTLRWIHSGTAGVGSGLAALRGTGVLLTNSAGVHAEPIADWVIAAIGYFARGDDLPRLASESDCLVIAAPHTDATGGAVSRQVLERLPRHAVVVNVSRGSLLDEAALLDLIDQGRLRGAALDVFTVEPLPPEHPFWGHPRILVSPHVSAVTNRFWERETALIVDNIKRYLAGAPLTNVVDLEAGY